MVSLTKLGVCNIADFRITLKGYLKKNLLQKLYLNIQVISLNINMDGIPICKILKTEFWPILGNVYELP